MIKWINIVQLVNQFEFDFVFQLIQLNRIVMKGLYKNKKLQLQSTNYLQNLHFPTHDYSTDQQQSNLSELSDDQLTQNTQLSDYQDTQDLNENVVINPTHLAQSFYLISSFAKINQLQIKSIEQNKNKYNQLVKKKQENRQKFIQKINKNLTDSQSLFLSSNPSTKNLKPEKNKKSAKVYHQNQNKIPRSQTQENKSKRQLTIKDSESNWDKNSQIDFNLTSQRQEQPQETKPKSAKKKITIKKKGSINSSAKQKPQQNVKPNQEHEWTKKEQTLNKSINEFLFMKQYQKDNKQLMNRLLTIIEQEHMNRLGNGSINQSIVRQNESQWGQVHKMQQSYNRSAKLSLNQIETEYSSVKPIVINNYIKSPTEFMGKGLIQKQIAIRMLEQNRQNKKSMLSSIADSRILHQSTIIALPSRNLSASKNHHKLQTMHQSVNPKENFAKEQSKTSNQEATQKSRSKDENELDFELLYQKLKNQAEKEKDNPKKQAQPRTIHQSTNQQTQKQSELLLPINSSRQTQSISAIPSAFATNQKTFATHNVSQNLTQFNPNASIQSSETQIAYNFKKPSVSMQIPFKNQNQEKQSISLADAFKKKFGAGNFGAKTKTISRWPQQSCTKARDALSQLKGDQNNCKSSQNNESQIYNGNFFKKQAPPSGRKTTVMISKKPTSINQKQNINPLQTPRSHSQHYNSTEHSTKLSKQPSKQLLDRLIYGHKATMSKKEMYELSKKNYMKLPQIQQKRKQEQKRLKQLQKKEKMKQYQKRIRSGKNSISISKESLKNSLQSSMIRQE